MKRSFKIFYLIIAASIVSLSISGCGHRDRYISFSGYAQGGIYTVKMNMNGRNGKINKKPEEIQNKVDSILTAIDNSISGYNRKSLLSRFNSGERITPDSLFIDIYRRGHQLYQETEGIIDVASGPLFDLWGFGFKSGEKPDDQTVSSTRNICGMHRLNEDMRSVIGTDNMIIGADLLKTAGQEAPVLNYNAIAQGYSCDLVAEYLYSIGVKDMLVDIGEIFCDGVNPSGQPWSLGIDKPIDGNNELGAQIQGIFRSPAGPHGIVTSGNYRKFYVRDGKKYAHTIDPRTGYPVRHNLLSATIVAADATTADTYATYCMVVGLEKAKELLERRPDLEGCFIYDDNGEFRTWSSEGFTLEEI